MVEEDGSRVSQASTPWATVIDDAGFPTLSPIAVLDAVARVLANVAVDGVAAIGVCAQRTAVVFLDEAEQPLLISPNADGRGAAHGIALEREHGDLIYRTAGRLPAILSMPARYGWVRENRPDLGVASMLSLSDWVVHALTGVRATEPTQAAESCLFDVAAGGWSTDLLAATGIDASMLPPVHPSGSPVGGLTGDWALPAGTPVVAAGADTHCGALSIGAVGTGATTVTAGTTMLAGVVTAQPTIDPAGRLWTSPTHISGRWVSEAHCGEAGALVGWMAELMGTSVIDMADEAVAGLPGGGGVVCVDPFPSPARDFALVSYGSVSFPAPVLGVGRTRRDVARSVFEGIAFAAAEGVEWVTKGSTPERIYVTGGVARSDVFRAALAGALERDLVVASVEESSAHGAAIVAAAQHRGGIESAAEAMADRGEVIHADPADGYPAHYAGWKPRAERARAEAASTGSMTS